MKTEESDSVCFNTDDMDKAEIDKVVNHFRGRKDWQAFYHDKGTFPLDKYRLELIQKV